MKYNVKKMYLVPSNALINKPTLLCFDRLILCGNGVIFILNANLQVNNGDFQMSQVIEVFSGN